MQCQIAAKKAETLPCLWVLPFPLTPISGEAAHNGQPAVQHALVLKSLKITSLIKRQAEAAAGALQQARVGQSPREVWGHDLVGATHEGTQPPEEEGCHNVGTGTAYLQYAISLDPVERGTQTLLHLTQSTA